MFRNRGDLPNITNRQGGGFSAPHYTRYWTGRFWVIHYDKTFIAIELFFTSIIALSLFAVYLFGYKTSFYDPIGKIKSNFLMTQVISIGITLLATGIVTLLAKTKESLIKALRIIAIISIIIIVLLLGINIYINSGYNEQVFSEFYETYEIKNEINDKKDSKKINVGVTGIKILNPKEDYVASSMNALTNFRVKTVVYMIIHIGLVLVIVYLSFRLEYFEIKKKRLSKDDAILYDEEENIKM